MFFPFPMEWRFNRHEHRNVSDWITKGGGRGTHPVTERGKNMKKLYSLDHHGTPKILG